MEGSDVVMFGHGMKCLRSRWLDCARDEPM